MTRPERYVAVTAASDRSDTIAFLDRALRLDDSTAVRLAVRPDGLIGLWAATGFDVLATRSVFGDMRPDDLILDGAALRAAVASAEPGTALDPGFGMDSAWRGALPAASGYTQVDDVPARTVIALSRDGAQVARTEGSGHGPATSLLDQTVLTVSSADGELTAGVWMRSLFAVTAMGFVRDQNGHEITESSDIDLVDEHEPVRIRLSGAWIRIDARYGSVYQRRERIAMSPL